MEARSSLLAALLFCAVFSLRLSTAATNVLFNYAAKFSNSFIISRFCYNAHFTKRTFRFYVIQKTGQLCHKFCKRVSL